MKIKTQNRLLRGVFFVEAELVFDYFISNKEMDAQNNEIYSWCVKTFGTVGEISKIPHVNWYAIGRSYFFSDPKDATMFTLRWL